MMDPNEAAMTTALFSLQCWGCKGWTDFKIDFDLAGLAANHPEVAEQWAKAPDAERLTAFYLSVEQHYGWKLVPPFMPYIRFDDDPYRHWRDPQWFCPDCIGLFKAAGHDVLPEPEKAQVVPAMRAARDAAIASRGN